MATVATTAREVSARVLEHLLGRIEATPEIQEPFTHIYLEDVFPEDIYQGILASLPDPSLYEGSAERHRDREEAGGYTRSMFPIQPETVTSLPRAHERLWRAVGAALTAPALKRAMFARLARDLAYRYGVPESEAPGLSGYSRPTLYRETEGFEIPPHPDTRKKIVTMHLYFPADRSQLDLGTALYRRKRLVPVGNWRRRFAKVKQFPFQPNSGYAFVVNNTLAKKSWHGREQLPAGAGVRNTLLSTYYETPRDGFGGYLA